MISKLKEFLHSDGHIARREGRLWSG